MTSQVSERVRGERGGEGGFCEQLHSKITDGGQKKTERTGGGVNRLGQRPIVTEPNGHGLESLVP